MDWFDANNFVLSGTIYSSSLVVAYPFDNYARTSGDTPKETLSKDDDVFKNLAKSYSLKNPKMLSQRCVANEFFPDGITNGGNIFKNL